MNRSRISTAVALLGLLAVATGAQASSLPATAGFAESPSRFLVGNSEATGNATVFAGESVTSGHLPTRLNLPDGSKYQIGVGSRVQVAANRLILDGGSLEILATGSAPPPVLQVAGLEFSAQDAGTRAVLYISRPDMVSASVNEGALSAARPNGEHLQNVNAGEMVTLANTRSDVRIDKRNAASDIAEIQAEQLRHLGKLGEINPTLSGKAGALLGSLAGASGGLISANLGGSSGTSGLGGPTSLGASSMNLAASSAASTAFDAAAMQKATQNAQAGMSDGLWGVTGCGAGCRFGVPIVTTHIFFAPTVGGFVRPFCIIRSCLEPPPFRP